MQENNELLLQLISDILDLSKIEAGTFNFVYTNVDVNETCAEIIKSMSMKVSKGVELILRNHSRNVISIRIKTDSPK